MNRVTSLLGLAFLTFAATAPADTLRQPPIAQPMQPQLPQAALATISVACSGAGHSDVDSRKHTITNNTGHTIPAGTVLHWTASDKGTGSLTLKTDLAAGGSVDVIVGGQTNGYTCTASFLPGPADFVIKSVVWSNEQTATVEIQNVAPWTDAAPSTARVESFKCVSTPEKTVGISVPAIPKGGTVSVVATISKTNADYLLATANANKSVTETNYANNSRKSVDFSTNKSCTPQ